MDLAPLRRWPVLRQALGVSFVYGVVGMHVLASQVSQDATTSCWTDLITVRDRAQQSGRQTRVVEISPRSG